MKFNVTVDLGKTSYAPGKPVPVGGKNGLSEEEAVNIVQNFGNWNPEDNKVVPADAEDSSAGIMAELDKVRREAAKVPGLEAEIARLKELSDNLASRPTAEALSVELEKVKELEEDRDALATEVQKLTTASEASATRIQQLEADLEEARKKVPK